MQGTKKKFRKVADEPTMSDTTLLLKLEDFIAVAFGKLAVSISESHVLLKNNKCHTIVIMCRMSRFANNTAKKMNWIQAL